MDSKFVIFLFCVIFMVETGVRGESKSKGKVRILLFLVIVTKLRGGGGGWMNRFSVRRISQKKFRIWRIFYTDLRILLIQRISDLSNILARIVDLACNLIRILDCDFIVQLLADSNLDKTIVGSRILLQIWADRRICIPLFTPSLRITAVYGNKLKHFNRLTV